ncbi:WD40 repeat domain-containing protein [Candidatus Protochlamydia amoebophila]|uniref:WD40 repeat domain-containing protein n=1 Tax=Candidatus Protochlamydia amoebophila TaxID=362787 RepID=UPI0005C5DCF1|nr:pentapeptide repeat-containing protein [Candidatus Protochlamydia amoebophila]
MNSAKVRQEATHYLRNPEKLKAERRFLLTIVRLSKDCIKIKVAAANALMILKKTNFSFIGSDFRGIQAPGVRLARTLLDKVNFSGANLKGANFTDCSLEDTILDDAQLEGVQFGKLPYLNHQDNVLAMALSPNGKHLASTGAKNLYVWNLETFEVEKQPLETGRDWKTFLLFFQDGQFLFKAYSKIGNRTHKLKVEIWKTNPLEMINRLIFDNVSIFLLLALTRDGTKLVSVGVKNEILCDAETEICLWQVDFNEQSLPQLTLAKKKIITGLAKKASYAPKISVIALYFFERSCVEFYSLPDLEIKQDWKLPLKMKKKYKVSNMIFTSQESQLIISILTGISEVFGEVKDKVYIWDIKNKKKKFLFFEKRPITNLQFLPDSPWMAYFTGDKHDEVFFRTRDKDFKLKFSEQLSAKINDIYQLYQRTISNSSSTITQNFISNGQFVFRSKTNQIFIAPLKNFVGKKEFTLSISALHFSSDEQTIYLWMVENKSYYSPDGQTKCLWNAENKLYIYQTSNGKNLGHKNLQKPSFEPMWMWGCRLSSNAQYCIKTYYHTSPGKNKIIISQVENKDVQSSYIGTFFACTLSKDNRYLLFIYRNQFELIKADFNEQNQLVDMDFNEQKTTVFCPRLLDKEKIKCTFSDPLFPITTLALVNDESGQINIWEIDWEAKQVQEVDQCSTELSFTNFFFLDQSKFYFRKDKKTLAIWDKKTRSEETIKFKNELVDFDISDDGFWMVTVEKLASSMRRGPFLYDKNKFRLWNLDQREKLDRFILPFHDLIIQLSPQGKFLILRNIDGLVKLSVWKIKKGKFLPLWKIPNHLNVKGLSLKNTQNLDRINALLLSQLQNEKNFHKDI